MEIEVMRKSPYAVQFDEINCFRFAFVDIEEPFHVFFHFTFSSILLMMQRKTMYLAENA